MHILIIKQKPKKKITKPKKKKKKKGLGGVVQVQGPELFNPQYHHQKKKKNTIFRSIWSAS
jgi:hypothetical protein